jgi:hypothetical protein
MAATPVAVVGRITETLHDPSAVGRFIEVLDDTSGSTGGAYICTWSESEGFDDWIESLDLVDRYMAESGYVVEWFDEPPASSIARRPRHA